jgi:hypothetical protein
MGRDHHETRAWVRMPSERRLDLLDPTPFDWEDSDLALGLARTYRWGGHTAWPLPLSVAQRRWPRCASCCTTQRRDCWASTASRRSSRSWARRSKR